MIELKNSANRKEIPKNENPEKIVDIVENILDFNDQQKSKGCSHMLASRSLVLCRIARIAKVYDHSSLNIY